MAGEGLTTSICTVSQYFGQMPNEAAEFATVTRCCQALHPHAEVREGSDGRCSFGAVAVGFLKQELERRQRASPGCGLRP